MEQALEEMVLDLARSGIPYVQICKSLKLPFWTVYKLCRRRLPRRQSHTDKPTIEEIVKLRKKNLSLAVIGLKVLRHRATVKRVLDRQAIADEKAIDPRPDPMVQIQTLRHARRCPTCHARVYTMPCVACLAVGKVQQ